MSIPTFRVLKVSELFRVKVCRFFDLFQGVLVGDRRRGLDGGCEPLRRLFSVELRIDVRTRSRLSGGVPNVILDTLRFGRDQWLRGHPARLSGCYISILKAEVRNWWWEEKCRS
jgi:hypothetical protein